MKTELSEKQIEQLFEFTRKHYVEYYDVQVELVDHLASSIEHELEQNPNLSFDNALNIVFKSFGIFGFSDVVENKATAVWKYQNKLWLKTFINHFKWPNVLKSVSIGLGVFTLYNFFNNELVSYILSGIIVLGSFFFLRIENRYLKKNNIKKLVLISQRYTYLSFSYLPFYLLQFFGKWIHLQDLWFVSSIFTILILFILAYRDCSKEVVEQAKKQYPEAFKKVALA